MSRLGRARTSVSLNQLNAEITAIVIDFDMSVAAATDWMMDVSPDLKAAMHPVINDLSLRAEFPLFLEQKSFPCVGGEIGALHALPSRS
jgi:hypothetical protein